MAGVDLDVIDAGVMLSVFTTLAVDDMVYSEVSRRKARDHIENVISDSAITAEFLERQRNKNRETWGATPQHQTGHQNAMNLVGGPAQPVQR